MQLCKTATPALPQLFVWHGSQAASLDPPSMAPPTCPVLPQFTNAINAISLAKVSYPFKETFIKVRGEHGKAWRLVCVSNGSLGRLTEHSTQVPDEHAMPQCSLAAPVCITLESISCTNPSPCRPSWPTGVLLGGAGWGGAGQTIGRQQACLAHKICVGGTPPGVAACRGFMPPRRLPS